MVGYWPHRPPLRRLEVTTPGNYRSRLLPARLPALPPAISARRAILPEGCPQDGQLDDGVVAFPGLFVARDHPMEVSQPVKVILGDALQCQRRMRRIRPLAIRTIGDRPFDFQRRQHPPESVFVVAHVANQHVGASALQQGRRCRRRGKSAGQQPPIHRAARLRMKWRPCPLARLPTFLPARASSAQPLTRVEAWRIQCVLKSATNQACGTRLTPAVA